MDLSTSDRITSALESACITESTGPTPSFHDSHERIRACYGPMNRAFAALNAAGQASLEADLMASMNRADDGTLVLAGEYLEVVIKK